MKVIGKNDEETKSTLTEQRTSSGIGGRQEDYIDFINYYKDDEEHDVVVAQVENGKVTKVGFNGQDYEKLWVEPDMPTKQYETFDDRKKNGGFKDFETMSNTQRQANEALKLGTVKGGDGLLYDREAIDDIDDDKANIRQAVENLFEALDEEIREELEQEEDEGADEDEE